MKKFTLNHDSLTQSSLTQGFLNTNQDNKNTPLIHHLKSLVRIIVIRKVW